MPHTFTRQELYDLVWSGPMYKLAKKYNISDRGLAKACAKHAVPVPERGYWNKLQASKKVKRSALPPRGLGVSDKVTIGGQRYWGYDTPSNEDILNNPLPPAPVFEEDISVIREKVSKLVGKVPVTRDLTKPHSLIQALLDTDEERREKQRKSTYPSPWDNPIFDSIFERRRLRLINSIFMALERCDVRPSINGAEARYLAATIGNTHVSFSIDSVNAKKQIEREQAGYGFQERGDKDPMFLGINQSSYESESKIYWQDDKAGKIEKHLKEIVVEIIAAGESSYRASELHRHRWLTKRKEDLIEEKRQKELKAERQRIEKQKQYEQACVDHLLNQANAFRQANEIRAYVKEVERANQTSENPMTKQEFDVWSKWALTQADRIDPVNKLAVPTLKF